MNQLIDMVSYFSRGMKLARSRPLRPWIIVPLLFNVFLFGLLYWLSGHWISLWISKLTAGVGFTGHWAFLNGALHALVSLATLFIWLLLLAIFASLFAMVVQLIAAPFMGMLAEKVDQQTTGIPLPTESTLHMILRTFSREARKTWYWLWRAVLLLILVLVLYLVPGLNLLGSIIWFLFNGWMMAMQYLDYGADCRQVSFPAMLRQMKTQRWLVLGFGCLMLGLTMLPLVNLVIMPVGVIIGTLIWNERLARKPAETAV